MTSLSQTENSNINLLLLAAEKLGIKAKIVDKGQLKVAFKKNGKTHYIWRKSFGLNSPAAIEISRDKNLTYQLLKKNRLPCLNQLAVSSPQEYLKIFKKIPFPQVIKPATGEKGQYIFLNIKNGKDGQEAVKTIFKETGHSQVVIESYFHPCSEYRFLVLNNQVIGIAERLPPTIIADGKNNIRTLIELENKRRLKLNQKRGYRFLNRMRNWKRIKWYLSQQSLDFGNVPKKGEEITLYPISNFSIGGSVKAVSRKEVHPSFVKMAEKTARVINLHILGIDVLVKDITKPASGKNCVIIEANSDPGIRLHDWPNYGQSQQAAEKILTHIFSFQFG